MLERATVFAATQLNGVCDGMPLRVVLVNDILDPAAKIEPMNIIVAWHGEPTVHTGGTPVSCRHGLFSSNNMYQLVGLTGNMGRLICNYMVEHGARHVVFTNQNPNSGAQSRSR